MRACYGLVGGRVLTGDRFRKFFSSVSGALRDAALDLDRLNALWLYWHALRFFPVEDLVDAPPRATGMFGVLGGGSKNLRVCEHVRGFVISAGGAMAPKTAAAYQWAVVCDISTAAALPKLIEFEAWLYELALRPALHYNSALSTLA